MSNMEGDGSDFTFSVAGGGVLFPCSRRRTVAARQYYPVFGQPRSPPGRGAPEPETMAARPPAPRCRKSGSTGSAVLRFVGLGRSHSDGKHRFVFFDAGGGGSERKAARSGGGCGDVASWSYYARAAAGGGGGGGNGGRRRTFLPYKQDLVGLFASATAFRRTYHPF